MARAVPYFINTFGIFSIILYGYKKPCVTTAAGGYERCEGRHAASDAVPGAGVLSAHYYRQKTRRYYCRANDTANILYRYIMC